MRVGYGPIKEEEDDVCKAPTILAGAGALVLTFPPFSWKDLETFALVLLHS